MSDQTPPPSGQAKRQAAFGFIFASALMTSVSFGIMIPILPNLIKQFTGGDSTRRGLGMERAFRHHLGAHAVLSLARFSACCRTGSGGEPYS